MGVTSKNTIAGFFTKIFGRRKANKSFLDSVDRYVPGCVKNGSKSLGIKGLDDFNVGEINKRNQYEDLKREVKYIRQTTGLRIMVLESEMSKLQEELDNIVRQRALLWQEMTQLQVHFEMKPASSEPEPMPREFGSTFH
ncbi:uncharacterized protein LOC111875572 [Cryptotermes secundus]|uniref:uncharacterized protein LOC111875572 n=1 Tax=Cryptotermes secundus TaxID=105785 RepID=UPI000CD7AF7F|nr:uncharacterized protein LOC111875572 [Cryptotermes secundus]